MQLFGKGKACKKMGTKGTTTEFSNLKQPHGANKYSQYTAAYSKYTAVYSRAYGRILRYWSLEYTAVYPKSPKWGSFKHSIDHYIWQTRGIPQLTYACIVHCTFVADCTCRIPLSPKAPLFTCIPPGIPGMSGYAHHIPNSKFSEPTENLWNFKYVSKTSSSVPHDARICFLVLKSHDTQK